MYILNLFIAYSNLKKPHFRCLKIMYLMFLLSFPGALNDKKSPCNAGDSGSIPGSGRSPGGGNGNPL